MEKVSSEQARKFLENHLQTEFQDLEFIGEGAWSRCFGYQIESQEFAIRFGRYADDFYKDLWMSANASKDLPIPKIFYMGEALGGYFVISERVHGVPLEKVSPESWKKVVPELVHILEALREFPVSEASGWGNWRSNGCAEFSSWHKHLLRVNEDQKKQRTHGWKFKLEKFSQQGLEAFQWGLGQLQKFTVSNVPHSLLHSDLINRNVLVDKTQITGMFDWGCSCFGDHLYDLAWFEFWEPWHSNLDIPLLHQSLEKRWRQIGYFPTNKMERLKACYVHIGLDHIAYTAHTEDWETLKLISERMYDLWNTST
tara:strand:+ start:404 stop:1339 length:936 start_codon:yes stop_codon:yes gene_type:complete